MTLLICSLVIVAVIAVVAVAFAWKTATAKHQREKERQLNVAGLMLGNASRDFTSSMLS
jgi:hypothetical protein